MAEFNPAALKAVNRQRPLAGIKSGGAFPLQNDNVMCILIFGWAPGEDWESLSAGFIRFHAIRRTLFAIGLLLNIVHAGGLFYLNRRDN